MDPESKKLLEETFRLAQNNNDMLRSMKRSIMWGHITRTIYWVFIIGSAVGAFYLLQPYINQLKDVYDGASGILNSF